MKDALRAALAGRAVLLFPRTAADVTALRVAGEGHAMTLFVIETDVPNLDRTMVLAAVGVLAAEWAPQARIAAIDMCAGADVGDVVAAAVFLATAESTTGQVLQISRR